MDVNIELPLNSVVLCQDGEIGESIELLIDPEGHQITHIVVVEYTGDRTERLVPVSLIAGIHTNRVRLSCTKAEFEKLNVYCEREVVIQQQDSPISDHRGSMYNFPVTRRIVIENKSIPHGKVAFDEETFIEARDGRVGRLDKFLVAIASKSITHLVMRSTAVFGKREMIIPMSAIDHIDDQTIHLKLTKKEVKDFSEVPIPS